MRLRAELIGEDTCTALGLTAHGSVPVLALCRVLVGCGYDPASTLEAYRGKTLCLTARSIGEAAGLVVENWRFRRVGSPVGAAKRGAVPDSGEEYARMGGPINRAIGGAQPRDGFSFGTGNRCLRGRCMYRESKSERIDDEVRPR
jgi:hypothetical protein